MGNAEDLLRKYNMDMGEGWKAIGRAHRHLINGAFVPSVPLQFGKGSGMPEAEINGRGRSHADTGKNIVVPGRGGADGFRVGLPVPLQFFYGAAFDCGNAAVRLCAWDPVLNEGHQRRNRNADCCLFHQPLWDSAFCFLAD